MKRSGLGWVNKLAAGLGHGRSLGVRALLENQIGRNLGSDSSEGWVSAQLLGVVGAMTRGPADKAGKETSNEEDGGKTGAFHMARGDGSNATSTAPQEPDGIRNEVWVPEHLVDNVTMTVGSDKTLRIKIALSVRSDSPEFLGQIQADFTKYFGTAIPAPGGGKFVFSLDLTISPSDSNADLYLYSCSKNPIMCLNMEPNHAAFSYANSISIRTNEPGVWTHELFHFLGMGHQENSTGSFMSYARNKQVKPADAERFAVAYQRAKGQ